MIIPFDNPIIQFLYWLVHEPGLGGIAVSVVGAGSILAYGLTIRWVKSGGDVEETETYAYPTPALTHSQEIEI